MIRLFELLFVVLAAPLSPVLADEPPAIGADDPCRFCFRGKPAAQCRSFGLLEGGLLFQTGEEHKRLRSRYVLAIDVGWMHNFSSQEAFGGSVYIGSDNDGARFGLVPRYRRWINRGVSVEVKIGLLLGGGSEAHDVLFPGFVGGLALSICDLASLDLLFEAYRVAYDDNLAAFPGKPAAGETETMMNLYGGFTGRSWIAWVAPAFIVFAHLMLTDNVAFLH